MEKSSEIIETAVCDFAMKEIVYLLAHVSECLDCKLKLSNVMKEYPMLQLLGINSQALLNFLEKFNVENNKT